MVREPVCKATTVGQTPDAVTQTGLHQAASPPQLSYRVVSMQHDYIPDVFSLQHLQPSAARQRSKHCTY